MEVLNLTDSYVCRICFQSDDSFIVQPCDCRGSLAYVHEDCIKTWILEKFPRVFDASCEICKRTFKITAKTFTQWQAPCDLKGRFVASVLIYGYFVSFKERMVYSVLILVFCALLVALNVYCLVRVFLSSFLVTHIKSWSILSNPKSESMVKPSV